MNRSERKPGLLSSLERFFFESESPFGLALVRMFLPLAAGTPMMLRALRVREFYTTDGVPMQLSAINGWGNMLPVFSPAVAIPLFGLMLCSLLLTSIGFKTRLSLLICTPLYMYFSMLDVVSTMTKYSVITSHLLLILTVSNCGAVWSVDAWLLRKRQPGSIPPLLPVWPARLGQLLFAFVYFGAAITKVHTTEFFTGAQMRYWMLSNWNYENPIGEVIAMWTPLLMISAYMALLWELMFCVLVWRPGFRLVMLGMGVFFHVMTWLTLGLYIFPAICLSGYFVFLTERDAVWLREQFHRLGLERFVSWPVQFAAAVLQRVPAVVPSAVCWACVAVMAAIGLAEFEVQADLYGMRASMNGMPLKTIDREVARTMIRGQRKVREQDKFFNFDIGTYSMGHQLADRASEFTYGDTILAQCNLNPPHEDLWVECQIVDDQDRTIDQFGQFVTREMMRADFTYGVGNRLLPGNYHIVLRSANKEISRRPFSISGTPCQRSDNIVTN